MYQCHTLSMQKRHPILYHALFPKTIKFLWSVGHMGNYRYSIKGEQASIIEIELDIFLQYFLILLHF